MADLQVLRMGSKGTEVEKWQNFLTGVQLYEDVVDGKFGTNTLNATKKFQQNSGLEPDGVVGNKTYGAAMLIGFGVAKDSLKGKFTAEWPPKPGFKPLSTDTQKRTLFGSFEFIHKPLAGNPENIQIIGDWQKVNIVKVSIPQLKRISGTTTMWFHKAAAKQLQNLWEEWERADLMHLPLTYSGSFNPRFIRGSRTNLSQHAFGTAFDINVEWNGLGRVPALVGQKGSVRELVQIANHNGFYWGGHFTRNDGMHFEIAQLL